MRATDIGIMLVLVLFAANTANAAAPAAPQVTMGADLKVLRFDWEPVAGATFYRLWVRPGGTRYVSVGPRIPASITHAEHAISVHLQNWERLRYVVTACNASGCSHSAALDPRPQMLDAIGYIKASNTDASDGFGTAVALSDDGYRLAVSAWTEDSNASGVDGDQANNGSPDSGAVYVFRRRGNRWQQEAYLKAGVNQPGQSFGTDGRHGLALSADGSILVAGATNENVNGIQHVGAVYVFRRVRNSWSLMSRLDSVEPQRFNHFGLRPEISDDGSTLIVMSIHPENEEGFPQYSTHTFLRSGSTWQHFHTFAPTDNVEVCPVTRLSGDGQTLVTRCIQSPTDANVVTRKRAAQGWVPVSALRTEFFSAQLALNTDATVMALNESISASAHFVGIYRWVGGAWVRETGIAAPSNSATWGFQLALDDNGRLLAVSDQSARELGAGISPRVMPGTEQRGAVYFYEQRDDATNPWALRNVVKSPNPGALDGFGNAIALSASGRTLAVGAPAEDGNTTGIDGARTNEGAANAGAAYLY